MDAEQLMESIERGAIHADMTLASTLSALWGRLDAHAELRAIQSRLEEDQDLARVFLERAQDIWQTPPPKDGEHPGDFALAAYLWLLSKSRLLDVAHLVSEVAQSKLWQTCSWAVPTAGKLRDVVRFRGAMRFWDSGAYTDAQGRAELVDSAR